MELADLVVATGSQANVKAAYKSRQARARRRPRQRAGHHRRLGRPRRCRAQDHAVEDASTTPPVARRRTPSSSSMRSTTRPSRRSKSRAATWRRQAERQRIVERLWVRTASSTAPSSRRARRRLIEVFELGAEGQGLQVRARRGDRHRQGLSAVGREAVAGADGLSRQGLRGRQAHHARRSSTTRARATPAASTPRTSHTPAKSPPTSTSCACWSTRRTRSATAAATTTALPFTLTMGCGTWQGNAFSDNLNWRYFVNITHLVTTIPEDRPSEEALFGAYWKKYGR